MPSKAAPPLLSQILLFVARECEGLRSLQVPLEEIATHHGAPAAVQIEWINFSPDVRF